MTETPPPTIVNAVIRIDPFLMKTGHPFTGDVRALAEQFTGYLAENLSASFTADHMEAGLFVATSAQRGDETAGHQYREGHFLDLSSRTQPSPARRALELLRAQHATFPVTGSDGTIFACRECNSEMCSAADVIQILEEAT